MRSVAMLMVALVTVLGGCQQGWNPRAAPEAEPARPGPGYLSKVAVVQEPRPETPPAVESALVWSEKCARALEDFNQEQQRNRKLADENRAFQQQVDTIKTDLAKTQRELQEANSLLIEVRRENDRWRTDVLGYRDEMRRAHLSELEALGKVLKLLGGEVPRTASATPTAPSTETAADNEPRKATPKEPDRAATPPTP